LDDPLFFSMLSVPDVDSIVSLYSSSMFSGSHSSTIAASIIFKLEPLGANLYNLLASIQLAVEGNDNDKLVLLYDLNF
jgi:hypothetical protein